MDFKTKQIYSHKSNSTDVKKVCLVLPTLKRGGMERVMSELANYIINQGHEVSIIFLIDHEPEYIVDNRIRLIFPNLVSNDNDSRRISYWASTALYVRRKIKEIRPHTVFSIPQGYSTFTIFALTGIKVPIYISDRNSPDKKMGFIREITRKIFYPKAAGIISQTNYAKESLERKGIKNRNIVVIPNPLKVIHNYPKPESSKNVILNIGRLVEEKNQSELIDIFSEIDNPDWKLHIIGNGPLRKVLEKQIENKGMQNKIFIFDAVPDVDIEMSKADIFAFTSKYEGFPNSLSEAMAYPLACISYECIAGPRDIIDNEVNGFLIENGNKQQYVRKLKELMSNDELMDRFMKESIKNRERFSANKISEDYLNFILDK